MKTPDAIKKGVECCNRRTTLVYEKCDDCPYCGEEECMRKMELDALALICKLEVEKYWLATECQKLREERDRYWQYIKGLGCDTCGGDCDRCEVGLDRVWSGWVWAGEKEEERDHECDATGKEL